jgi:H+-transporting ATPase
MVLILFLNDFLTMSISTDRMEFSRQPNCWNTRGILLAAVVLAACKLIFSLGVFLYGHYSLRLYTRSLQTLTFATLIFSSQAGVYLLRERGHFWQSRPGRYLVGSSVLGLGVTALLALGGIFMPAISSSILLGVVGVGVVYFFCLDWVKVRLFARLELR